MPHSRYFILAAFCSPLHSIHESRLGEGFKCDLRSGFWSQMGVEVMVAFESPGVSTCTSVCEASETVGFYGSLTPSLDPIKSIRFGLFASITAPYFVAFCLCSSLDIDFTGILECDEIDVAKA